MKFIAPLTIMRSFRAALKRGLARIGSLFRSASPAYVYDGPAEADAPPPPKVRRAPRRREKRENFGTWYSLGGLLEDLGDYFRLIRQLRRFDEEAYALYRSLGGRLISRGMLVNGSNLEPGWLQQRPAFGMVYWSVKELNVDNPHEDDKAFPSFIYFMKMKNLEGVPAMRNGDLYKVGVVYYDNEKKRIIPCYCQFPVFVRKDGAITPLRTRQIHHVVPERRKTNRPVQPIPTVKWSFGEYLEGLSRENTTEGKKASTPEDLARHIFTVAANQSVGASDGFQVRAVKDNLHAMFNIDMLRTPHFFRDRDKTINVKGARRKIFHIVATHNRTTAKGSTPIKTHFRGERMFQWHGHHVTISMPGYHHIDINEFGLAARDVADPAKAEKMVEIGKVAEDLSDLMDGRSPARIRA